MTTLEGLAVFTGPEESVFIRVGEHDGNVVLDLCDKEWRVAIVDKNGWRVVKESPIRFRRTRGMLPLPVPVQGDSINDLRNFINFGDECDFVLICGFVLGCFHPHGPYAALLVNGEQGSAKSMLCRLLRLLVDPNKAPLRSAPKDERDLSIAANNAWIIGLDNMSQISERVSNALCRLATGGGFSTRALYSNSDEMIFDSKRPILINGIGEVADRGDLLDRAFRVTLPTIPEDRRRTERSLLSAFEEQRPAILGAFLDAVSAALRNQHDIQFTKLPRMADVAMWIAAAEPSCPWNSGSFLAAMEKQRREADEFVIESSLLASAIRVWIEQKGKLVGTATEILDLLSEGKGERFFKHPKWPRHAQALGSQLREATPNLRRLGFEVFFDRSSGKRVITILGTEDSSELPS